MQYLQEAVIRQQLNITVFACAVSMQSIQCKILYGQTAPHYTHHIILFLYNYKDKASNLNKAVSQTKKTNGLFPNVINFNYATTSVPD